MNNDEPLLKIRFDGNAVGPGKIPLSHLLHFFSCMNKALLRTAQSYCEVRPSRHVRESSADREL